MRHWCELCHGKEHVFLKSQGFAWHWVKNEHVFVIKEDERTENMYYTNSPVFKIELVKKKLSEL